MARRLSKAEWAEARAMREGTGASFQKIGKKFGVSHVAVHKRATAEKWSSGKSLEPAIVQRALENVYRQSAAEVNGLTEGAQTAAQALEAEVKLRAEVIGRHRNELKAARALLDRALQPKDDQGKDVEITEPVRLERARAAKTVIDALATLQTTERKAYGLAATEGDLGAGVGSGGGNGGNLPLGGYLTVRVVRVSKPIEGDDE